MSSFMGGTGGPDGGIPFGRDDLRLVAEFFIHDFLHIQPDAAWHRTDYVNGYWPGATGMDASGGEWLTPIWFDQPEMTKGMNGRVGFVGITRDVYGTAIPGATVKCFRTVDDSLVSQVTSGTDGSFTVSTPWLDAHYLVSFKPGTPNVAGATDNTLLGA